MPGPAGTPGNCSGSGGCDVKAETQDNIITLTGHVRTWAEQDTAVSAAWMANGVIDVRDELHVTG
jgi:osmotically-inducible protein OsmY